jgi:anti-sigma B factor antagonist
MLSLTIHNLEKVTLVRCAGRITADCGNVLRNGVITHVHTSAVVLDLGDVSALDAAGLGILVVLWRWADATGKELKLLNLTPRVEELLELTKLRPAFEVCSVRDMLDLLCRLSDRAPQSTEATAPAYLAVSAVANERGQHIEG